MSTSSINSSKGTFQPDSDVHIVYEDQQKINKFARLNAKLEDFKEELKNKQNDLKNIEDASDELMLLDEEDTGKIPFMYGEIFLYKDLEATQKAMEEEKAKLQKNIEDIEEKCNKLKSEMSELKVQLYAKFRNHINLEAEEE